MPSYIFFAHMCQYTYGVNFFEWHYWVPGYMHVKLEQLLPHCLPTGMYQHALGDQVPCVSKYHAQQGPVVSLTDHLWGTSS